MNFVDTHAYCRAWDTHIFINRRHKVPYNSGCPHDRRAILAPGGIQSLDRLFVLCSRKALEDVENLLWRWLCDNWHVIELYGCIVLRSAGHSCYAECCNAAVLAPKGGKFIV